MCRRSFPALRAELTANRRAGANDCPDVLTTQRGGQPAWHQSIDNLHALNMACSRHDLNERTVKRQRTGMFFKLFGAGLSNELRLRRGGPVGVDGVYAIDILHDGEASGAQRIGQQKRPGVGSVVRNARIRKLVVVVRRKGTPHHSAGRAKVDRKLAIQGRVLDVGNALRGQE